MLTEVPVEQPSLRPDTDGTITSTERLPESGGRLIPWQACLKNVPHKLTAKKPFPGGITPPACHLASYIPADISLCCLTALPWLAGIEQAVSKGPSAYFIPVGHAERADLPRNADGGLVAAPGSLGGVAETHMLRRGVPD